MKDYAEWSGRQRLIDLKNRFSTLYKNDDGSMFYIEPVFYNGLQYFRMNYPDKYQSILEEMDRVVRKYRMVVFTGDSDDPITIFDEGVHSVFLTVTDITDRLSIYQVGRLNGKSDTYGD